MVVATTTKLKLAVQAAPEVVALAAEGGGGTTVTGVTVRTVLLARGASHSLAATVTGTGSPAQTVTWEIVGSRHAQTTITGNTLTIARDETQRTITVRARSTVNTAISSTATIHINAASTISAGNQFNFVIKADGSLWAWGSNSEGVLGLNNTTNRPAPERVGVDNDWAFISAGSHHALGIKTDGSLWAWGRGASGQLGQGSDLTARHIPTRVGTDNDWAFVSGGNHHSLAIKTNGSLWVWGANDQGQLGLGNMGAGTNRNIPTRLGNGYNWAFTSGSNWYSLAIRTDGSLWAWGNHTDGGTGLGETTGNVTAPVQIQGASNWVFVSAGLGHSLGIRTNGSLYAWGNNEFGRTGLNTTTGTTNTPQRVGTDTNWAFVSAGGLHSLGLRTNGSLWAWGRNLHGRTGQDTISGTTNTPQQVGTDTNWVFPAAGADSHSLAIRTTGVPWTFGGNSNGALGIDSTNNSDTALLPIQVHGTWP